jgi:iron only hydrogenase large subunit-like protein
VEKLLPLSGDKLNEVGSPQQRAARWIADKDPEQLDVSNILFEQRYSMAVLFHSLNGDAWGPTNWLSEASECDWDYVEGSNMDCRDGCINGKVCSLRIGRLSQFVVCFF